MFLLFCHRGPPLLGVANSFIRMPAAGRSAASIRSTGTSTSTITTSRQFLSSTAAADQEDHLVVSSNDLAIYHLRRTVDSTQDEIKRLLEQQQLQQDRRPTGCLAVIADSQHKGRGTSGRAWVASEGNLFLTCAIPMNLIPMSKITLLPLGVGLLIAELLDPHLSCRPKVKWPNDVLVDAKKIAGTLIESHRVVGQEGNDDDDFWLIGIGINVKSHPSALPSEKKDFRVVPRSATSIQEYHVHHPDRQKLSALDLGVDLTIRLQEWTKNSLADDGFDAAEFMTSWKAWSELGAEYEIRGSGEKVRMIDIAHDGRLLVVDDDGKQRLLVADYFY